jgi:hypothetical protein
MANSEKVQEGSQRRAANEILRVEVLGEIARVNSPERTNLDIVRIPVFIVIGSRVCDENESPATQDAMETVSKGG